MEKSKIERINALARKAKETTLTEEEKNEQNALRQEYVAEIRASLTGTMENTYIQYPDGHREKVERGNKEEKI